jgi:Tfp pilus assembly PilM family ATPase
MTRILPSLRDAAPPAAAVALSAERVTAAVVERRGGRAAVAAHAMVPLPPGALVPSLTTANLADRAAVGRAVRQALEQIGRPRRVGLVVPDPVAKVSLVKFQQVPSRTQDLEQLVRWQVRKAAPFPVEDAQISFVPGARGADGQEFVVSLARREVVAEYEGLCLDADAHPGIVDLSTFNVINAVLGGSGAPEGDWLLVNVAPDWASMAILRGADLMFFRNRGAEGEGTLADLVHQTAMYYEDRLSGSGFERVMLCGGASAGGTQGPDAGALRGSLEDRLKTKVDAVDPRAAAALTDRVDAPAALLDALAPLVGFLVRDREAA